jgi:hypothetical protein
MTGGLGLSPQSIASKTLMHYRLASPGRSGSGRTYARIASSGAGRR